MKLFKVLRRSFVAVMLSFMAMAMLPACSSSEEAPPPDSSGGGGEDCSKYTNPVDISECEVRNEMID